VPHAKFIVYVDRFRKLFEREHRWYIDQVKKIKRDKKYTKLLE